MRPPTTAEIRYAKFEAMGEPAVREAVRTGALAGQKRTYAEAWLAQFDDARRTEIERSKASAEAEHLAAAISAKDAAWEAARAAREQASLARTANTIATVAIIAAAISIAVSVVAVFVR